MCFNQQVSSVDRNLHGYGSEPFSPSDNPKHEQTSLTIFELSVNTLKHILFTQTYIYVYIYRHKIIIYSMVDIDPSHNHST